MYLAIHKANNQEQGYEKLLEFEEISAFNKELAGQRGESIYLFRIFGRHP